jgi:hypothetical protein
MVPGVVMGGGNSGQTSMSNAQNLVDMLTAKTAKEMSVDMSFAGKGNTAKTK